MDGIEETADSYGVRLGRALRTLRDDLGLSQEDVADAISRKQNYISRWETGSPALKLDEAERIETALGKPRGYLLRLAGYVVDPRSTIDTIAADPKLSDDGPRDDVLVAYRQAVKTSTKNRRRREHG